MNKMQIEVVHQLVLFISSSVLYSCNMKDIKDSSSRLTASPIAQKSFILLFLSNIVDRLVWKDDTNGHWQGIYMYQEALFNQGQGLELVIQPWVGSGWLSILYNWMQSVCFSLFQTRHHSFSLTKMSAGSCRL